MKVVELHPRLDCQDLAKGLRNIADDIERCEYEFSPNLAVIILAAESQSRDGDGIRIKYDWQTHGLGERATYFTTKGVIAAALTNFDGCSDE